jgi:hypothetical protein
MIPQKSIMDLRASILDFKFDSRAGVEACRELKRYTGRDGFVQLKQFLDESRANESGAESSERRLFIIETTIDDTTFPELRELLNTKLGVSRDIFQRHQWSQTTFRFNEVINCPRLPTTARPRRVFSLEYFELWQVGHNNREVLDHYNPVTVECISTGRQIQCYKWMKSPERGWLLVAPRKCSFWSRQDSGGWTGK